MMNNYRTFALLFTLCLSATLYGQTGLERMAVYDVFGGRVADTRILSETYVTNDELAKYHLSVFRSVQCSSTAKGLARVERLLAQDAHGATEKEVQRDNRTIRFALFRYAQKGANNHYIIYQRRSQTDFLCVYLEGTATIQQLKKTFSK